MTAVLLLLLLRWLAPLLLMLLLLQHLLLLSLRWQLHFRWQRVPLLLCSDALRLLLRGLMLPLQRSPLLLLLMLLLSLLLLQVLLQLVVVVYLLRHRDVLLREGQVRKRVAHLSSAQDRIGPRPAKTRLCRSRYCRNEPPRVGGALDSSGRPTAAAHEDVVEGGGERRGKRLRSLLELAPAHLDLERFLRDSALAHGRERTRDQLARRLQLVAQVARDW